MCPRVTPAREDLLLMRATHLSTFVMMAEKQKEEKITERTWDHPQNADHYVRRGVGWLVGGSYMGRPLLGSTSAKKKKKTATHILRRVKSEIAMRIVFSGVVGGEGKGCNLTIFFSCIDSFFEVRRYMSIGHE